MKWRLTEQGVMERLVEEDGNVHVQRRQDIQSLIDRNHEESVDLPSMHGDAAIRKVGSIPLVVAEQWSRECGASIGTREFAHYAKKKVMDGEFAAFRIKGC